MDLIVADRLVELAGLCRTANIRHRSSTPETVKFQLGEGILDPQGHPCIA
jgi:hypothetical protein